MTHLKDELKHAAEIHLKSYHEKNQVSYAVCNLRDPTAIRSTIKSAADFFGGTIDVLVNNASIASPKWKDGKTFKDEDTLDEWQAYIETNLTAPFVVSQACVPYMIASVEKQPHVQKTGGAGPCSKSLCSEAV